jgi:hypothetical protein
MAEAIQDTFRSLLYQNEVIHHETMSPHDEVEGTLGLPDSALAYNKYSYPEDVD